MPIPIVSEKKCGAAPPSETRGVSLPVLPDPKRTVKKSKMGPIRAAVLVGIHVLIALHVLLWWVMGMRRTVSPVEPSESMYTLEQGLVNAGFVFFSLAILSTAIFGRWFCGWGCHIVALQDSCGWIMKKCGVKPRPFRSRLLVFAPLVLALYMFVWPTFKREVIQYGICDTLHWAQWDKLRPYLGDTASRPVFQQAYTKREFWETFAPWYVAIPFFGVCGFAAVYFLGAKGYCTYGCPYGGFFGPVDRLATGRIRVTDACEHCGHCTAVCTSNVRVHEEVRDFGMVVDPGCMKCLDCVNVCPNDALYFGFGKPAGFTHGSFKMRAHDLTWPQELLAGVAMWTLTWAYRNMLGQVPLLMAIGIAAIAVFLASKVWQMVREPSVRLQSLQLKIKGSIRPAGAVTAVLALGMLGIGAWGAAVRHMQFRAELADDRVHTPENVVFSPGYSPSPEDKVNADQALRWFTRTGSPSEGGWGWPLSPSDRIRMAWLSAAAGRLDLAEVHLLAGLRRDAQVRGKAGPSLTGGLAMVMNLRGESPDQVAAAYEGVLKDYPRVAEVRVALAGVRAFQGKNDEAAAQGRQAIAAKPYDPEIVLPAAGVLLQVGGQAVGEAEAALRTVQRAEPRNAAAANLLGIVLTLQGDNLGAIDSFTRASRLEPKNPGPMQHLAQLLKELHRDAEAAEWAKKAVEAGAGR